MKRNRLLIMIGILLFGAVILHQIALAGLEPTNTAFSSQQTHSLIQATATPEGEVEVTTTVTDTITTTTTLTDTTIITTSLVVTPTQITPTIITAAELNASNEVVGPYISHGPVSGEVMSDTAVLWARASEPGTMFFTVFPATADNGESEVITPTAVLNIVVDADTDLTGEVQVTDLTPGQGYYYRVTLVVPVSNTIQGTPTTQITPTVTVTATEALTETGEITDTTPLTPTVIDVFTSEYVQGYFVTPFDQDIAMPLSFVFGSCLGGQGYCRDPETGWYIFDTMLSQQPDFFVITGDSVYVDSACTVPDNVAGAEGPYTDLDGFQTRYRYHLEDPDYATFLAQTPIYVTWDDHEIRDDFGGPALQSINPELFTAGQSAFFNYWPLMDEDGAGQIYRQFSYGGQADFFLLDTRSYRDPNVNWDPNPNTLEPKTMLGPEQFAWLQAGLANSNATWKFIVTSTPLSYPTGFPQPQVDGRDGWANYTERSGYETELMSLIFFIESQDIGNVVFLTGDTHWPFALSYDPDRNGEVNFYEFGSSPLSAINLPPVEPPDPTFNPTVMFAEGEFQGTVFNFGRIQVDKDGLLTFEIVDRDGAVLYSTEITPE